MSQQQSHYQSQQQHQHRQQSGNPQEQRREFLWRERVRLEMQVQALIVRAESLEREWCMLQHYKARMQQHKPKLAAQIMLSGLAGMRSLPAERLFLYERERLMRKRLNCSRP